MKSRGIKMFAGVCVLAVFSLFPTWTFSERLRLSEKENLLWDSELKPIDSQLTKALRHEQLRFETGRGAESGTGGICYGDFGSDEYWVVIYDSEEEEIDATAWIVDINWLGHLQARRRFSRITEILEEHVKARY